MQAKICVILFIANFCYPKGDFLENVYENVIRINSEKSDISPTCSKQLEEFESSLSKETSRWAWKMIDATSKLQSGILEGNFGNLGAFDECVRIKENTEVGEILGKYCLGTISAKQIEVYNVFDKELMQARKQADNLLEGIGDVLPDIQWSACLPSACMANDFTKYFINLSRGIINITFADNLCQTDKEVNSKLSPKAIAAITIFSIILGLVCVSTLYDLYLHYTKSKPAHIILIAFSVYTNGSKLFVIGSNNSDQLSCLNGLRVISMMWVVIGHQYSTMTGVFINMADIKIWMDNLHSMYILGATVSVDTFFVLSGLLMTYGFLKAMSKGTVFNIPLYWLHRYLRLTPALAAVVLMEATLTEYFGSGPLWPIVKQNFPETCRKYWWSALLYVQNYVNPDKICVGQSWYLSVDMQLFILSPLVLWPLWKWKRVGLMWLCFLILASIATPFAIVWEYDIKAMINFTLENPHFINKYYFTTHTRAAPWLIGIFVGYLVYKVKMRKESIKMSKGLVIIIWAACLAVLITCVFGGHSTLRGPVYDKWAHVSYITFIRPAWATALAWLIFACITGYGGPINWFLSFPMYQVLGRLTYSIYLLHGTVAIIKSMSTRSPTYFSDFEQMYLFWGMIMFSTALSVVWNLAFESPMITIEKVLFHGGGESKLQAKPAGEDKEKC